MGGGGGKWAPPPPPHTLSFLNIFKMKRYDFALLMTFSYYLFWTFLPNFSRKFWLVHELLWFCQRVTKKFKKKFFFKCFFFFWKQHFLQNISSIRYVEVVNMFFFIWNHIIFLAFENKYIRIGNFVDFLSESMELTSDRFFYLLCKTICFNLFFLSIVKSVIHCHS